jgi:hypothetical protein
MSEPQTESAVPPVDMVAGDQEAPYGRRADGTPKSKPGRRPGQATGTGQRKRSTSTRTPSTATPTDYRTPLLGLFQIPAGALAIAGMQRPVFAADAAAITIHAPNIAEALDQLAQERPEIAAVLDRVLQVGPYGVLIAAVAPMVLQLLANHRAIPPGVMGTVPAETLVANFMPEVARMAQEASEQGNGSRVSTGDGGPDLPE